MQAGILKRVLEEVEKVMHEFRGMLYKSMEDPQIDLADVCWICFFFFFWIILAIAHNHFVNFIILFVYSSHLSFELLYWKWTIDLQVRVCDLPFFLLNTSGYSSEPLC